MQLQLGDQSFDVTTRALTLLSLGPEDSFDVALFDTPHAPDLFEVDAVERITFVQGFPGPIVIHTSSAAVAAAGLSSGAEIAHDPDGLADPSYLRVIEEADAGLIISCPTDIADPVAFLTERVRWALAAGVASHKIVVTATAGEVAAMASLATVMFDGGSGTDAQGMHAVAVMRGARIITRRAADADVRTTRRTIDTVSELLERRETAGAR